MTLVIKNPIFRYLHKDSKVYYISKRGVCFGTNEYYTVPLQLTRLDTNCLVGYTCKTVADKALPQVPGASVYHTSCKDLGYISSVLKFPLVVVMESDTGPDTSSGRAVEVFFNNSSVQI
jgi:hypothetical protein